jgi:hypothetical protein
MFGFPQPPQQSTADYNWNTVNEKLGGWLANNMTGMLGDWKKGKFGPELVEKDITPGVEEPLPGQTTWTREP